MELGFRAGVQGPGQGVAKGCLLVASVRASVWGRVRAKVWLRVSRWC